MEPPARGHMHLATAAPCALRVPLLRCVAFASSVRHARKLVALGRVYVNGRRAEDERSPARNWRKYEEIW